jgi:rfaE bifunctional protein kinase chain/domain
MEHLFNSFNEKKIMIVGDMMLDIYMNGKVERISPEAPVPIVSVTKTFSRLGGAANVAQNLKALGAEPILCSITGQDEKSNDLLSLMHEHNMNTSGIVRSNERITTTKVRIIGNNAQMLRVDTEDTFDLTEKEYDLLLIKINEIIDKEEIDGIILQDYNKGVLTEKLIKEVISIANKKDIPIGVDPKKKNFLAYQNATFFKPNLKELKEGIGISTKDNSIEDIINAVDALHSKLNCRYIMTTLSERGVLIKDYETNTVHHIPAHLRKIADVSGAGDTVLSVAMLCLVCKQDAYNIALLSNLAGGLVCEELGAVPINKERLFEESKKIS